MRLSLNGVTCDTEVFNTSLWFQSVVIADPCPSTNAQAAATLAAMTGLASWAGFASAVVSGLPATGGLRSVTLYCYPGGGSHATAIATSAITVAGTGTGNVLSPQDSLVVSLRTAQAGRSNRGRMYLPWINDSLDATHHQTTSAKLVTINNGIKAWLNALTTAVITPAGNGVFAVIANSLGQAPTVTTLVTDSLIDTQRRRRNKLVAQFRQTTPL